jgi:hypothetical protein
MDRPARAAPEAPGACLAFDTGPANAPMDDLMHARGLGAFDHEGALAQSGRVSRDVVRAAMGDRFFARMPPKSLDRNDFAGLLDVVSDLSDTDASGHIGRGQRGGGPARHDASSRTAGSACSSPGAGGTTRR